MSDEEQPTPPNERPAAERQENPFATAAELIANAVDELANALTAEDEDEPPGIDPQRLFRAEALISDGDLRVDVARELTRTVGGDDAIHLRDRRFHARGDASFTRGSRHQEVFGNYSRDTKEGELYPLGLTTVEEMVRGDVDYTAELESETIMGGVYAGTTLGAFMRMAVWADFLCWGGWVEADLIRVEIAGVMIRAMTKYNHACLLRLTLAGRLIDDFVNRTENFGTFFDNQASAIHLGGPSAVVENAS